MKDKALRERREQLFVSGRKQQEHEASKECTFSPHLRQKSGKNMTLDAAEGFYQKNIDWQRKVQKETKLKQCEKINEGVTGLTFMPKIVTILPYRTPAGTNPARKMCHCWRRRAWRNSCSDSRKPNTASRPSRVGRRTPTRRYGTSRSANSPTYTDITVYSLPYPLTIPSPSPYPPPHPTPSPYPPLPFPSPCPPPLPPSLPLPPSRIPFHINHEEYLTSSPINEPFFSFIITVSTRSYC